VVAAACRAETASTKERAVEKFRAQVRDRGLHSISARFSYDGGHFLQAEKLATRDESLARYLEIAVYL